VNRTYKSYEITSTAWLSPDTKQWKATVLIIGSPNTSGPSSEEKYLIDIPFADELQAESAAIEYARRLIDRRV
jgi:hypothetical protein